MQLELLITKVGKGASGVLRVGVRCGQGVGSCKPVMSGAPEVKLRSRIIGWHNYGKKKPQFHGIECFLISTQFLSYTRKSLYFIEPGSSLPCPQKPATDPYPKPD